MSAEEPVTKIGDTMLIIGGELPTGTQQLAGATGSPLQGLRSTGVRLEDMQIAVLPGRTYNREELNRVVLRVRGRTSDRAPVNKVEGAKWPPVANEAGAVAAPLAGQAVGISSGERVIAGRPAGVQASEAEAEDTVEVAAVEAEDVEDNE